MEREAFQSWLAETRCCLHWTTEGAVIRGCSNGLRRYRCKGCGKTSNASTGTPPLGRVAARPCRKALWSAFAAGLGHGDTVKGAAERCGVADTASFRSRHHFLAAVEAGSVRLKGIVEADETDMPTSPKGAKMLVRKPRKWGGVVRQRGLAKEQVPNLVAADRSGTTLTTVLPDDRWSSCSHTIFTQAI